MGLYSR